MWLVVHSFIGQIVTDEGTFVLFVFDLVSADKYFYLWKMFLARDYLILYAYGLIDYNFIAPSKHLRSNTTYTS